MHYARLVLTDVVADYSICARVVDRQFKFDDDTKDEILEILWNVADFCGVLVLDHCIMDNHFHLEVRVQPQDTPVSKDTVLKRVGILYGEKKKQEIKEELKARKEAGDENGAKVILDPFRKRMNDLSEFMKTFKQRITMSYNFAHHRTGTLWEGRFRSTLIERTHNLDLLRNVAAYFDLNPMRAGIVDAPERYRWCGFGLAQMKGIRGARARKGLALLYPGEKEEVFLAKHRQLLLARFQKKGKNEPKPKDGAGLDQDYSKRHSPMSCSRILGSRYFVMRIMGKNPPGGFISLADGYVAVGRERKYRA